MISSRPANTKTFRDSYVLSKTLGSGNFSVVRKCRHKFSKNMYAAKIIQLVGVEDEGERVDMVRNEVNLMRKLRHPNILSFVDVFYTSESVIVVLDLTELGDLHDFVVNENSINEDSARLFALEIAAAVNFIHSQNIVHRDIKAENFLLFKKKTETKLTVKLCDFGLAEEVPSYGLSRVCGSPSFVAPEILNFKSYGLPVDVWSMGVLFYFLICGRCPFEHEELSTKFDYIMQNELEFSTPPWDTISSAAKDLIGKMLVRNPKCRLTANAVLYSRWFRTAPSPANVSSEKPKITFKSAAIAVKTTNALLFEKYHSREDAVVSRNLLEGTCSLSSKTKLLKDVETVDSLEVCKYLKDTVELKKYNMSV